MNTAQQIHHLLGIATPVDDGSNQRSPSYTKAGPGRRHNNERAVKNLKQKRAGSYGRGLRNWIRNTQAAAQANRIARSQP